MRFNKQELTTLATQPSQKFDKEGVLFLRERQEGFFRRTEISLERWCRLRGNLLFYFKSREQWSEPLGVIILEQCSIKVDTPTAEGPYGFHLVFDGGLSQHLAAYSEGERDAWLQAIQLASYDCMRSQLLALQQRMELCRGQDPDLDVHMLRIRRGNTVDPSELPLCEISLACDNLLCDGHGRPPNPVLVVHVYIPTDAVWVKYAKTEVIERSSNPGFLNTVTFRASDGLSSDTRVRLTAYDMREHVSQTATPIGSSVVTLGAVQETDRLRIPLLSPAGTTVGFLTLTVWNLEPEDKGGSTESTPCRSVPEHDIAVVYSHRRSQSLPPRLGTKLKLPHQGQLCVLFANPHVHTYRFHSGLGGDIYVHEVMAESKLCFLFPQQLLALWIQEEKELLQEVAGMGELHEPWHTRQVELLDRHLHLLHLYSQAKENLEAHKGSFFKPSSRKNDRMLEFAPVNLHLQRMWVQNDTLRKCGFYDIITVGAFTAHSHKSKNGGLIKLLQQLKESPSRTNPTLQGPSKILIAHDAIQAIKQLRQEVVDGMRALMKLAKEKQTAGMLPICEDMISKTRILLSLWDPGLVEEALSFVEEHKVSQPIPEDPVDGEDGPRSLEFRHPQVLSPYRRITQQLNFDMKSPDIDDLVTPDSPHCTRVFWSLPPNGTAHKVADADTASITALKSYGSRSKDSLSGSETQFEIFPDSEEGSKDGSDQNARDENEAEELMNNQANQDRLGNCNDVSDVEDRSIGMSNGFDCDLGRRFLDTQAMCSSPSANYYKPTDEPEPWDLTQLNIEASVMCLVSKVKFLCGRCGSPAVRLRSSQRGMGRSRSFRGGLSTQATADEGSGKDSVVTVQPTSTNGGSNISSTGDIIEKNAKEKIEDKSQRLESIGLSTSMSSDDVINKAVDTVQKAVNGAVGRNCSTVRNKFTEGLDFASIVDWTCELRPSMRKLRQAMDGLLKTARLTHSVFRVQEDVRGAQRACNVRYRRDVCFSQALTSLVVGLMAKLWCQKPDPTFLMVLTTLGPLISFEGLLSYCGDEIDMWGDMAVAVEDLLTVTFTLTRCTNSSSKSCLPSSPQQHPVPRVVGSRSALTVVLPVPDSVHSMLPLSQSSRSFTVTPVFFNVGINEMATLAESLGNTRPQDKSNLDNYERVNEYYHRFRKLHLPADLPGQRGPTCAPLQPSLLELVESLKVAVHTKQSKNVDVLHLSSRICRRMKGLRFTSCKSAKDRTGMSVTLEQCHVLVAEYGLSEHEIQRPLDCMRSEGCRRENTYKNTGVRKYAFNSLQLLTLPKPYRPPAGTYGSAQT
ncbi:type I inositol 3,4-bisphosphate 4-phosphatase isoform X2 [Zootermopsis nevadensis]|uniref:type I inositol 3,4-bisphosphate 4-phosphatase isoform X2 n=1 Tax=Zootermopsis nevadensis TaxID=136037 RepID=UPI000B8EAB02|nr:type I inositol 3,4-bisphosphate 4-phosphatase isoform X2 [Zootermopsis nevadensis]